MKSKVAIIIATAFIFVLSTSSVNASNLNGGESQKEMNKETDIQYNSIQQNMDTYISQLEEYVKVNENGTIALDSSYKQDLNIPTAVTNGIEDWIDYLNELIKDDKANIKNDLSVSIEENVQGIETEQNNNTVRATASGRSGSDVYWWGYNVFLDSNETRTTYQSLKANGGGAASLAAISRFIPVPPTQLASAISGAIGGGLVGFGNMIQDEHEGNGVRIRFTGLGYAAVPTGVFPQ